MTKTTKFDNTFVEAVATIFAEISSAFAYDDDLHGGIRRKSSKAIRAVMAVPEDTLQNENDDNYFVLLHNLKAGLPMTTVSEEIPPEWERRQWRCPMTNFWDEMNTIALGDAKNGWISAGRHTMLCSKMKNASRKSPRVLVKGGIIESENVGLVNKDQRRSSLARGFPGFGVYHSIPAFRLSKSFLHSPSTTVNCYSTAPNQK